MSSTVDSGPITDLDLLERVRSGDDRALGLLYDRHATVLYSLALAIVREAADAEEVVTDAFLKLWKSDAHDGSRGSVGAYLAVITRSKALDKVRSARRRARAEKGAAAQDEAGFATVPSAPEAPDELLARSEAEDLTQRALGELPEPQREAIALSFLGGYTHKEIAERTSTPLGTVKTRIRDGMSKLKAALSGPTGSSA